MPGKMSNEGDLLLTSLRPRSAFPVKNGTGAHRQSLLSTMNQFISAVDEMDDAVMIPCKLQDMHLDSIAPILPANSSPPASLGAASPSMVAIQNGESDTKALVPTQEDNILNGAHEQDPKHLNLYNYYEMLRAIKEELVLGTSSEDEEDNEVNGLGEEDDMAKQTATMFRHHLRGLFDVLQKMTSTADSLTARYQSEIGDSSLSSTRRLAHFTL